VVGAPPATWHLAATTLRPRYCCELSAVQARAAAAAPPQLNRYQSNSDHSSATPPVGIERAVDARQARALSLAHSPSAGHANRSRRPVGGRLPRREGPAPSMSDRTRRLGRAWAAAQALSLPWPTASGAHHARPRDRHETIDNDIGFIARKRH
jgi:hypothetical protein